MLCSSSLSKVKNAIQHSSALAGMKVAAAPGLLHHVGEALLPSEPAVCRALGQQESSKTGGKVLLVLGLRKDSMLREGLV